MAISSFIRVLIVASLTLAPALLTAKYALAGDVDPLPSRDAAITVNGNRLAGPNSSGQRRGGRLYLPVNAIARSLGDIITVNAQMRTIIVRRQTGTTAEFDAAREQVSENGSVVLTVSNTAAIIFTLNPDELLLPVEIVAALLDAGIRFDDAANTVIITRGSVASPIRDGAARSFGELYQIDYDYSLNRYSSFADQNLNLNAIGRIGDGRFMFVSGLSGISLNQMSLRRGTFTFDRPNGQRYAAGDLGTGTELQFLSSNIRGGEVELPFHNLRITAFGGRTFSGVYLLLDALPGQIVPTQSVVSAQNRVRYDTNIFGIYATTNSSPGRLLRPRPFKFAAGVLRFSGANRRGDLATGAFRYEGRRFRIQGDLAAGSFNGVDRDGSRINGNGTATDISATYQVRDNLSVQARYAYIGAKFLSPQAGYREPVNLKAAGISWSPKKWLSTTLNASTATRPGDPTDRNSFVTATVNISPRPGLPSFFISHTVSSSKLLKNAQFTLLTASRDFARFRLFANATRIKTIGPASLNAQFGASFRVGEHNSVEASQSVGSRGAYGGQLDWRTNGLFAGKLSLAAGAGYTTNKNAAISGFERFTASLNLPRQSSLQLSYTQTNAGPTLMLSLRGSLFRRRDAAVLSNAAASDLVSLVKVSGRVYQDINLNGQYDPGVDLPQANVQVRVDGNRYVTTDANGVYTIDAVRAGDHRVYVDLLSVRADLTLLDGDARNVTLQSRRDSVVDFRLVRTGRISGTVWFDANGNGRIDDGEEPLADIRIVAGSGRDTLTDANGRFVLADLPPGEHVILIDEKTLPEKMRVMSQSLTIKVFAGRETGETNFAITAIPAEVKRFGSKSQ